MKNLLYLASKIHERGNSFITAELKKNGAEELAPSHGDILMCLYNNNKITMKDIAEKIHRTRPTVTVLVNKLEKLGYVKRETSNEDSRYIFIELTQKGKDFKPVFENISTSLNKLLYKNLSKIEAETVEHLLIKVIE